MTNYVLSIEAEFDLEEIENYSAQKWGDNQAEKYIRDLFNGFEKLGNEPNLGRSREDVPFPYLVYGVGSHLIIYRHNQELMRVEILNILHPAMNIDKRLIEALNRQAKSRGSDKS